MTMRDKAQMLLGSVDLTAVQYNDTVYSLAKDALRLSYMMSEPDWGVGMLEDVAEIVGKDPNPDNEPRWERH